MKTSAKRQKNKSNGRRARSWEQSREKERAESKKLGAKQEKRRCGELRAEGFELS